MMLGNLSEGRPGRPSLGLVQEAARQPRHFLNAPVPGASLATLNLAQVAMAVEFTAAELTETADGGEILAADAVVADDAIPPPVINRAWDQE